MQTDFTDHTPEHVDNMLRMISERADSARNYAGQYKKISDDVLIVQRHLTKLKKLLKTKT